MPSRSDHLHSHQFLRQRAVGALAMRDPDVAAPPARRVLTALFAGSMVALLGLAGAAVYGILRPAADDSWTQGGAIIVEPETGTQLILRAGVLHPMLNYASARLALGAAEARTLVVPRQDLSGTPRGATLGIPGAPDLLPPRDKLTTAAWTVCTQGKSEGVVYVSGGPATAPQPLGDKGLLVSDPDGDRHLLWAGRRYPVPNADRVLPALGWTRQTPVPAAAELINAVPGGASLVPPDLPGQLYKVESPTGLTEYAVERGGELISLTPLEADLLGREAKPMPANNRKRRPLNVRTDASLPEKAPDLATVPTGGGICVSVATDGPATIGITASAAGDLPAIVVPPDHGALVSTVDGLTDRRILVTDTGYRYLLASPQVQTLLGYQDAPVARLPSAVLALLPEGPTLDTAEALRPAA